MFDFKILRNLITIFRSKSNGYYKATTIFHLTLELVLSIFRDVESLSVSSITL